MIILYKMSNVTYERECRWKKKKGKKAAELKTGNRGESAKATESPSALHVPLARLQIYSTSFFYFSPLFFRSSELSFYCSAAVLLTIAKPHSPSPSPVPPSNSLSILFSVSPLIDT